MSYPRSSQNVGKFENEQQCFLELGAPFAIDRRCCPVVRPVIDLVALPQINHLETNYGKCEESIYQGHQSIETYRLNCEALIRAEIEIQEHVSETKWAQYSPCLLSFAPQLCSLRNGEYWEGNGTDDGCRGRYIVVRRYTRWLWR